MSSADLAARSVPSVPPTLNRLRNYLYIALQTFGLELLGVRSETERPKVAIRRDRIEACIRCLIHIVPVGASLALIFLTLRWPYVGSSLSPDVVVGLQLMAKLSELLMVTSLSTAYLSYLRTELLSETGLPFGVAFADLQATNLSYLWSKEFFGSLTSKNYSWTIKIRFALVTSLFALLSASVGPAVATCMILVNEAWRSMQTNDIFKGSLGDAYLSMNLSEEKTIFGNAASNIYYSSCGFQWPNNLPMLSHNSHQRWSEEEASGWSLTLSRVLQNISESWIVGDFWPILDVPNELIYPCDAHYTLDAHLGGLYNLSELHTKFWLDPVAHQYGHAPTTFLVCGALCILLVYSAVSTAHLGYSLWTGFCSSAWSSVTERVALAINSRQAEELQNTCAGIETIQIYQQKVRIAARASKNEPCGHLEIVFPFTNTSEVIAVEANRAYGTLEGPSNPTPNVESPNGNLTDRQGENSDDSQEPMVNYEVHRAPDGMGVDSSSRSFEESIPKSPEVDQLHDESEYCRYREW